MWRAILRTLEAEPAEDVMRRITSSHGLCERAEELLQVKGAPEAIRCYLCPLFHALGAHPEDIGCQSLTRPMLDALLHGDRSAARAPVARLIRTIEQMPIPADETERPLR